MNVQYITDSKGETTGVFIPISDWIGLKSKYGEFNEESVIPEFHKEIVRSRIRAYENYHSIGLDFDSIITELEN